MKIIKLLEIIFLSLAALFALLSLGLKRKALTTPYPQVKKANTYQSFAIIIPARNESSVIEATLKKINDSAYPKDKLHIFVMVEDSKDPTLEIAKKFDNVTTYIRQNHELGKGYVVDEMIKNILNAKLHFDNYLFIDADNFVKEDFIAKLNDALSAGYDVVCGKRNCKNWNSSPTSACSAYTFFIINFLNYLKTKTSQYMLFTGTGFAIKGRYVESFKGWPFHSLTEDYELSKYAEHNKLKTYYHKDAIFYDEQPILYKDSIKQRTRWVKGFFNNNNKDSKVTLTFIFNFGLIFSLAAFLVLEIFTAIFGTLLKLDALRSLMIILLVLGIYYIAAFLVAILIVICEHKVINIKWHNALISALFHPIFLAGYLHCIIRQFKKGTDWEVITHSINELN